MDEGQKILQGLNPQQRAAVLQLDGPVLIIAGAGSGKTRVLTSRIAWAIAQGKDPERMMALTFTKKAAGEMKDRIAAMVGGRQARKLYMGTFHSVFIRFLRDYADFLGYPKTFTIYDTSDSQACIKACVKELGLDDKIYKPKEVLSRISDAKNKLVAPASYAADAANREADLRSRRPRFAEVYDLYWKKCRQSGVMDFDDILYNMNYLLFYNKEAREEIAGRFDYLMVDEYQDTNHAQYNILKLLCCRHCNICVVGDDSQSIYAFRGARVENILRFENDFGKTRVHVFRLEQNYRSTRTIVDAANSLIEKNRNRLPKVCFSEGEEGERIHLIKAFTDQEEALLVTSAIAGILQRERAEYKDFAVLYRTNAQSRLLEEQLRKRNIPYVIFSGNSFFERMEVKDLMAYFKLVVNPDDDESFKRIVNKPARGIGDTSLAAVGAVSVRCGCSLFKAACNAQELAGFGMKAGALEKLSAFCRMISEANAAFSTADAYDLAFKIATESGLWTFYKSDTSMEGQSRAANFQELLDSVKSFVEERQSEYLAELQYDDSQAEYEADRLPVVTLDAFLENISLLSAVDTADDDGMGNKVTLMTVHASKGLEFPHVFITGLEENLFPSGSRNPGGTCDIEEERRLFYVALTRAARSVTLSFCSSRMHNGQHENNPPSRFIGEIDRRFIENPLPSVRTADVEYDAGRGRGIASFGSFGRPKTASPYRQQAPSTPRVTAPTRPVSRISSAPTAPREDFVPSSVLDMKEGQRVEHAKFGEGTIITLTREGSSVKAKVHFDQFGDKLLLLQYAKLRILES
ncbi:MAG: UvrD-helicase domain-containing protein [Bacteroidales bacterium]|nr:UvrD-helicase domain-containing protein [Bacteroidales bacterium]